MLPQQLFNERVTNLGFSEEFCSSCGKMGLITLGDILALKPEEVLAREGFNYGWLAELTEFLGQRGLLEFLQPIPGKSADRSC